MKIWRKLSLEKKIAKLVPGWFEPVTWSWNLEDQCADRYVMLHLVFENEVSGIHARVTLRLPPPSRQTSSFSIWIFEHIASASVRRYSLYPRIIFVATSLRNQKSKNTQYKFVMRTQIDCFQPPEFEYGFGFGQFFLNRLIPIQSSQNLTMADYDSST